MSRPRAETIPAVTVPPRPNGLPTATPNRRYAEFVRQVDEREIAAAFDLDQGNVVRVVSTMTLAV